MGQALLALEQEEHALPVLAADAGNEAVVEKELRTLARGLLDHQFGGFGHDLDHGAAPAVAEAAPAGQDHLLLAVAARRQSGDAALLGRRADDGLRVFRRSVFALLGQGHQLVQHRGDEFGAGVAVEEHGAGVQDPLQVALPRLDRLDVPPRAQGAGHGREQLLRRQVDLGLVVVDVVLGHDLHLGRLARLPGAQDDAHVLVPEVLADMAHEPQAGILALHDHVQQDQRDLGVVPHDRTGLRAGVGADQLETPSLEGVVLQDQARERVDLVLVVDDQDLPEPFTRRLGRLDLSGKSQEIVSRFPGPRFSHAPPPRVRAP